MKPLMLFGLAALVGVVAPAALAAPASRANPDNPAQVALGQKLYAQHCASCHGAKLQGEFGWNVPSVDGRIKAPPHDPTGHTHEHSDDYFVQATRLGAGVTEFMPRYRALLSDDDALAILAFIKSTWPFAIRVLQAAANPDKAGMSVWMANPDKVTPQTCKTLTAAQKAASQASAK